MSTDALKALALPQQLQHWARTRPDQVALRQKQHGIWQPVTWKQYADRSRWFGLGLDALVGTDFEAGLASLANQVPSQAAVPTTP